MKKLNKNGFAISTMLYGLLIIMVLLMSLLMSTMSFSRSNSKKFVNKVIENLEYRDSSAKITLEVINPTDYETFLDSINRWVYIQITAESPLVISGVDSATIIIGDDMIEEKAVCSRSDLGDYPNKAIIGCHIHLINCEKMGYIDLILNGTIRDSNHNIVSGNDKKVESKCVLY